MTASDDTPTENNDFHNHELENHLLAERLNGGGLGAALAEQCRAAPWYVGSLAIHIVMLAALLILSPAPDPTLKKKVVSIAVQDVVEDDPIDEPEKEPEEIVDVVEFDQISDTPVLTDVTTLIDTPDIQVDVVASDEIAMDDIAVDDYAAPVMALPDLSASAARTPKSSGFALRQGPKASRIQKTGGNARILEAATRAALDWLKFHQPAEGLYGHHCVNCKDGHGHQITEDPAYLASATAMAALAFMGYGSSPTKGEYRKQVQIAIDALLKIQKDNGEFFVAERRDKGGCPTARPYAHAIVLQAIAEAHAMSPSPRYASSVRKGVEFALSRQRSDGGWFDSFTPNPKMSDTTSTGWYIMALIQAREAGISVPAQALAKARAFMHDTAFDDTRKGNAIRTGLFVNNGKPEKHEWTMDALNLTCLQFLGVRRADPKVKALAQTVSYTLGSGKVSTMGDRSWNFFGQYFAALGLFQFGASQPRGVKNEYADAWAVGNKHVVSMVPQTQIMSGNTAGHRGSWDPRKESAHGPFGGRVGLTAAGALITEVFYRYDFVKPSSSGDGDDLELEL